MDSTDHDLSHFSKEPLLICSLCECPPQVHAYYYHCPLLDGEFICADCCLHDVDTVYNKDTIKEFKKIGKEYTKEHIDKTCTDCGRRCVGERLEEENF